MWDELDNNIIDDYMQCGYHECISDLLLLLFFR